MEAFHSGLQMMSRKNLSDGLNNRFNVFSKGVVSRVISKDPCINKIVTMRSSTFEIETVMLFDYALLSLWAEKYLPPEDHETLLELTELFRAEMGVVFTENKWMDKKSKEKAIQMLEEMKFNIGYPSEILDEEKMKAYHNQFLTESIDPGAFFENKVAIFQEYVFGRSGQI